MEKNTNYTLKRGETGTELAFTLYDADGAVNLAGWTVTLSAKQQGEDAAIADAACTVGPNQTTTGKGKGVFTFDPETAAIPAGSYDLEFKGVSPGGAVHYFPKSKGRPYASLTVIEPLA